MSSSDELSVGFVGAGMMASALMNGLIDKGVITNPASSLSCTDIWQPALDAAASKVCIEEI